jgi:hypothetical protein
MWSGCESDHPPASSAAVKNAWSNTSTSTYLHVVVLIQVREENFTFNFSH